MSAQSDAKKGAHASDHWRDRSATKRQRKRPYVLEWRYVGRSRSVYGLGMYREWSKFSAYETRKQRDQALEAQQRKERHPATWAFRAVDKEA